VKRLLAPLAPLVLLVVLLGACGGSSSSSAATVNKTAIDRAQMLSELDALSKVPGLTNQKRFVKSSSGTFDTAEVASYLDGRIIDTIVEQQMKTRNVTVSDQNRTDAAKELPNQLGAQAGSDGKDPLDGLDPKVRQTLTDRLANTIAMIGWLSGDNQQGRVWWTDTDVKTYFDKSQANTEQSCTKHILVKTKEEADAVLAQLKSGGDFAKIAASTSIDTGTKDAGGDLGCNPRGAFIPEFEAAIDGAKAGQLVGPVQTQFGFHVIEVDTPWGKPAFDDTVKASIEKQFATPNGWLQFQFATSTISVDKRFGTWDPAKGQTVPPASSTSTTTTAKK
jgi:hypothetical protein